MQTKQTIEQESTQTEFIQNVRSGLKAAWTDEQIQDMSDSKAIETWTAMMCEYTDAVDRAKNLFWH